VSATKCRLLATDGHSLDAWICEPAGVSRGGVVVLHAVYGLTDHMGLVCERWAAGGYTAVAPALFDRLQPNLVHPYATPGEGTKSYNALTERQIFDDILAATDAAGGLARTAISGFCTGGTWAWKAGAAMDFPVQVNFYGSAIPSLLDLTPRSPTILHFGDSDHIVPLDQLRIIAARHPKVELRVYPKAGHAFENSDQSTFDRAACDLAWGRSIAFMSRHLG
jgi:carboxymethylenebutenolidase